MVSRCIDNKPHSWTALLRASEPIILRTVFGFTRDYDTRQDMLSCVFYELFTSLGGYRMETGYQAWLRAVTRNVCIDFIRSEKRISDRRKDIVYVTLEGDAVSVLDAVPDTDTRVNPEAALIARERMQGLSEALQTLSEAHRTTLRVCFNEQRTLIETSAVLGIPVGTVKSRINTARRILKSGHGAAFREAYCEN